MTELLHDPDTQLLGKKEAVLNPRMIAEFLDIEKAQTALDIPANIINSTATAGGTPMSIALAMYLNDQEGDCTIAGVGNILRVDSNGQIQIADADVQTGYVDVTKIEGAAFDPSTKANDNGCVELDVLDYWVKVGVGGNKLLGHAGVKMTDDVQRRTVLHLCGPIYPGWQLSTDQQSQQIWQPGAAAAGSWGGHCAPICDEWTQLPSGLVIGGVAIDPSLGCVFNVLTWQQYKACLLSYLAFACDEGHALITDAWVEKAKALGLIDEPALDAYLKTLQPEA